ncbi:MAG: NAD(P)/FAD-dependent oxidoreductase [Egibacteraceae bacterium]
MTQPRVIVIGGGIAGLASAHHLSRQGAHTTLLESSEQLGGLGTFFRSGEQWVERFYHCVMPTDGHLLSLLGEIGLADAVRWRPTRMGFVVDGTRYPFNTPLDLLRFRPLTLVQRLRLGVVSLLLRHLGRGEDLDNVRSEDWLRGLYGDAVWERVLQPLFRSKFGPAVGDVPALYLFQRLGREKNVATRGYPEGGYKAIIDGLRAAIETHGGTVRTATPVTKIRETPGGVRVELSGGEAVDGDWVVSTVPLPLLHQLADAALKARLPSLRLPYLGVVNVLFFLARPLDGCYWTPVLRSGTEFDGVIETSTLAGTAGYDGRHLAYVMKYTDRNSALFAEDDASIADRWTKQLLNLYADLPLRVEDVCEVRVFKAPFVEPVYPLGYGSIKPAIDVGETRLLLATTAHIYPQVTSWNSSAGLAHEVVDHLLARHAQPAPQRVAP